MKKIINGKLYNTETAHLVGTWSNEMDGDFSWTEESLYQKKTGEFFIYGQGGAHTRYAQNTDATHWVEGEAITLISYDDARQWAEEHLTADQYQEAFGEVTEDSSRVSLNLSLPAGLVDVIKKDAYRLGMTVSDYVASKMK